MNFTYDYYGRIEPSRIYLAKPGHKILGVLNGVDPSSVQLQLNFNNYSEISFDVKRYIASDPLLDAPDSTSALVESSFYDYLDRFMELYVSGIGWFKIQYPASQHDGRQESKHITAYSLEIELNQFDLKDFSVGTGTEYAMEMLAVDNVIETDGFLLARDRMRFWRDTADHEALITAFADTAKTLEDLAALFALYPAVLRDAWRFGICIDDTLRTELHRAITDSALSEVIRKTLQGIYDHLDSYTPQSIKAPLCAAYPDILAVVHYEVNDENTYTLPQLLQMETDRMKGLSLLDVILKNTGWSVGSVDDRLPDPKDPNIINKADAKTLLAEKVSAFEDINQDVYSFLMQEVQGAFHCIFDFDTEHCLVHALRLDCLGEDTNLFLGFRNVQNSMDCHVDEDSIYTRFQVAGGDDLSINYVNFGSNELENIDYFLTPKYFDQSLIDKYRAWQAYRDQELISCPDTKETLTRRQYYASLSRQYNAQLAEIANIQDRVPSPNYQTDWSTFSDEELTEQLALYEAQLKAYESLYVDEDGHFDLEALKASPDWEEYHSIEAYAIPNIKIEMEARDLSEHTDTTHSSDDYEYIDDWETDWSLYGPVSYTHLDVYKRQAYNVRFVFPV